MKNIISMMLNIQIYLWICRSIYKGKRYGILILNMVGQQETEATRN
jgi:hypothetical protein